LQRKEREEEQKRLLFNLYVNARQQVRLTLQEAELIAREFKRSQKEEEKRIEMVTQRLNC